MNCKAVGILVLLLAVASAASALGGGQAQVPNQARRLTLDQATCLALKNHPALKQAQAGVVAAEAQVTEARSAYFPQLSFSAIAKVGLSGATSALGLPGFPASPFYRNAAYSGNWLQTVFDFGRIKDQVALEQALAASARLNEAAVEQRIVFDVKRAYFAALQAQKLELLGEQTMRQTELTLERARVYAQTEIGSQLDVGLAEASAFEARGRLIQTQDAAATAFAALHAAMGVEGSQVYELEAPAVHVNSPPPLRDLVQEALKDRPDERALESQVAASAENVRIAHARSLPTINAFAAGGQGRFNGTPVKVNQRHGVGALGLIVPIFTGGRLKARRQEAQADFAAALAAREELRQRIRLQVSQAYYRLLDLAERVSVERQQQQASEVALGLAQVRYREQLGSYLDILTAQLAATRTATLYARTGLEYETAKAALEFATAQTGRP